MSEQTIEGMLDQSRFLLRRISHTLDVVLTDGAGDSPELTTEMIAVLSLLRHNVAFWVETIERSEREIRLSRALRAAEERPPPDRRANPDRCRPYASR
jgi:hypothetical protein